MLAEKVLSGPFERVGKYGCRINLPDFPRGDRRGNPVCSRLYIYEDGKLIGQPHCGATMVYMHGKAQYVHWEQTLFFSASDNSDPNLNGREYKLVWDNDLYYNERAKYFYETLLTNLRIFGVEGKDLRGKSYLEIGCGRHHGMSLVAAGFGANVVAADRYAPVWDDEFHPGFLEYMIRTGPAAWPGFDAAPLQKLLDRGSFDTDPLTFHQVDAESLVDLTDRPFDFHSSQAALEHFYDVDRVAAMLYQTAKSGSIGCHWVDFRDHTDFARPLDFLFYDDKTYDDKCGDEKYVNGNRVRPHEYEALWQKHGFRLVEARVLPADLDMAYFNDVVPRLRASGTRFANESEESLKKLSVIYVLRKD